MGKLFYLGVFVVVIAGFGCAVSNYSLITDNDQGNGAGSAGATVNTNGKAKLRTGFQVATIWPDGTDEMFSMVDQKANGDRTLTTYNNYNPGGAGSTFLDDTYCSPDWNGCAIFIADDPEVGDDPFDGSLSDHCNGARSLQSLTGSSRYYGECGRGQYIDKKFQAIANLEIHGELARGTISPATTTLLMQGVAIPIASTVFTWDPARRQTGLDLSSAAWYQTMAALENAVAPGETWGATLIWNGIRHDLEGRRIDRATSLTFRY